MNQEITLVNRGRGLQLSTHRVRVQDLVPFFQEGCSTEEIIRWIPTLTRDEIAVVEQYYRQHKQELDDEDRRIRARNAQRKNSVEVETIQEEGRRKKLARLQSFQKERSNGEPR
jgi:uncharacterized protein (DUF433 family)